MKTKTTLSKNSPLNKFKWMAVNKNGATTMFVKKPFMSKYVGMWCASSGDTYEVGICTDTDMIENWDKTLQRLDK